jgi:hypothetical protein
MDQETVQRSFSDFLLFDVEQWSCVLEEEWSSFFEIILESVVCFEELER